MMQVSQNEMKEKEVVEKRIGEGQRRKETRKRGNSSGSREVVAGKGSPADRDK